MQFGVVRAPAFPGYWADNSTWSVTFPTAFDTNDGDPLNYFYPVIYYGGSVSISSSTQRQAWTEILDTGFTSLGVSGKISEVGGGGAASVGVYWLVIGKAPA
jgi:hypothetical protein